MNPDQRYLEILERILADTKATTRLGTDATIAALALESGAEAHTHDARNPEIPRLLWEDLLG